MSPVDPRPYMSLSCQGYTAKYKESSGLCSERHVHSVHGLLVVEKAVIIFDVH